MKFAYSMAMMYLCIKFFAMTKRIKWAMLALLGFSTACSTVKNSAKESAAQHPEEVAPKGEEHRIRVLYGVRRPDSGIKNDPVYQDTSAEKSDSLNTQQEQ